VLVCLGLSAGRVVGGFLDLLRDLPRREGSCGGASAHPRVHSVQTRPQATQRGCARSQNTALQKKKTPRWAPRKGPAGAPTRGPCHFCNQLGAQKRHGRASQCAPPGRPCGQLGAQKTPGRDSPRALWFVSAASRAPRKGPLGAQLAAETDQGPMLVAPAGSFLGAQVAAEKNQGPALGAPAGSFLGAQLAASCRNSRQGPVLGVPAGRSSHVGPDLTRRFERATCHVNEWRNVSWI
jgi:hypothetical protein